jgi:capsular polysaccharide biosynthesis protein
MLVVIYIKTYEKGGLMNSQTNANYRDISKRKEINLKDHFTIIKKRLWILVLLTFITTSIGMIKNTFFVTPLYQSTTRIIIGADELMITNLKVLMRDSSVLQLVVNSLGINRSPEGLAQQISVNSVENSQIVSISVVDTDPKIAAEIANTTANIFKDEIPNIIGFNNVKLLTAAKINPFPINPAQNSTIIMFALAGLVIGIGIIYFLDTLDDSVRSNEDIENLLGLTVLGNVSRMNKKSMKKKNSKVKNIELRGETVGS